MSSCCSIMDNSFLFSDRKNFSSSMVLLLYCIDPRCILFQFDQQLVFIIKRMSFIVVLFMRMEDRKDTG